MLNGIFLNPAGLVAAIALLPFLILYLIKPKPRNERVPSLLFLMRDTGRSNIRNFFRTFLKDILFILQLLLLLAIILSFAKPYINVPRSYLVEQTVLLVDVSGSMRAREDGRFDEAIDLAKANLGGENTVILVKGTPEVLVERASSTKAREALDQVEPTETSTDLTGALQLAMPYATTGTRVVVIGDLHATSGDPDYETAAAALEGRGAIVDYLPVAGGTKNVGIVDLLVGPVTSTVWLKNYEARPAQVTIRISDAEQQVLFAKGETKEITFKTPPGVAELSIREEDDLLADNTAWTSSPEKNTVKLLIITNDEAAIKSSNFLLSLNVIQKNFPTSFDIQWAQPPKIPKLDHDVYVIDQANLDYVLPGYVKDLRERVEEGASLVVFQQEALFSLDWQGLLPVEPVEESQGSRSQILPEGITSLTQDIEFGQTSGYYRVAAKEGTSVVARTEQDPAIVLAHLGKGIVLYYGLDDARASFSKDPSYPVFWRRAFDLLTDRPSLANLNVRTGSLLALQKQTKVKTPSGTVTTNILPMERAGLYVLPDRTIAANMLSSGESDIAVVGNRSDDATGDEAEGSEKAPKELTEYLLWAAIALLLAELLYLKYRGDY